MDASATDAGNARSVVWLDARALGAHYTAGRYDVERVHNMQVRLFNLTISMHTGMALMEAEHKKEQEKAQPRPTKLDKLYELDNMTTKSKPDWCTSREEFQAWMDLTRLLVWTEVWLTVAMISVPLELWSIVTDSASPVLTTQVTEEMLSGFTEITLKLDNARAYVHTMYQRVVIGKNATTTGQKGEDTKPPWVVAFANFVKSASAVIDATNGIMRVRHPARGRPRKSAALESSDEDEPEEKPARKRAPKKAKTGALVALVASMYV